MVFLMLAICMQVSGCTHSICTHVSTGISDKGIPYMLPKSLLKLDITYTVRDESTLEHSAEKLNKITRVTVEKPIKISQVFVPDNSKVLSLSVDNIADSAFLESALNYTFDGTGVIKSISADTKDHTLETVGNAVSAGLKVASIAAAAGADIPADLQPYVDRIEALYREMGAQSGKVDTKQIKAGLDEIKLWESVISEYRKANAKTVKESEVEYATVLDVDRDCVTDDAGTRCTIAPNRLIHDLPAAAMPPVIVTLSITSNDKRNSELRIDDTAAYDGILYRLPKAATMTIEANSSRTQVYKNNIFLPQYGQVYVANVSTKSMADRKTELEFNQNTGGLNFYKVTSGSSADKALEKTSSMAADVQKSVLDLKYNLETGDLKAQKDLVTAQKGLLDAQKALNEVKGSP
jgi:hypothetical protein